PGSRQIVDGAEALLTTAQHGFCDEPIDCSDSIRSPFGCRLNQPKYGNNHQKMVITINYLSPPYFFRAVRRYGEYRAERDQNRPGRHSGSQELFAKKPANTGDFERSEFEERALPKG
ncbi:MAG: hypothetical protein WCJ41_11995, partial [Aestuariivirga sp.]|uniref:hypothetical protein n=1 Tax=Aestuariivirga sp. TaxID=2650926 RepID=UPI003017FBDA